ncbi:MAG TPA: metallophosphoesterase family protein [Chloroflexota bacterium]|jgi:hypothetical protein
MRCLVLADVHGNLTALEAVLDDAGAVDAVWCLGDVVGLGAQPEACVERAATLLGTVMPDPAAAHPAVRHRADLAAMALRAAIGAGPFEAARRRGIGMGLAEAVALGRV